MRNFKELKIWQKGFDIAVKSIKLTAFRPKGEKFRISSQITRSAVSIPSNMVEGSSRTSEKEYNRFLEISPGLTYEPETQLLILRTVNSGSDNLISKILSDITEEQKMLISFMNKLNK